MDIAQLSDSELRSKLKEYGVNPGPIGATTRLFYEKKLGKLIDSGGVQPQEETEEEEEEDEEEVMEEEVQINYRTAPRTYASPPAPAPVQRRPEPISTPQGYTPITKARKATVDTPQTASRPSSSLLQKPASKQPKTSGGGSGIAMWIKLLFIVIIALLVYLVIINMNQSAQSKIPISHQDV